MHNNNSNHRKILSRRLYLPKPLVLEIQPEKDEGFMSNADRGDPKCVLISISIIHITYIYETPPHTWVDLQGSLIHDHIHILAF